jgi:YHS domain-containing protein
MGMTDSGGKSMRLSISMPVVVALALAAFGCGQETAQPGPAPEAVSEQREPSAVATERDPVCGMYVDPKTAPKSTFEDETFYFCSLEDKAKFDKDPGSYASQAP